eukprot:GHVS01050826.1.p1 GENE.GHVS01050826.1~~GHVS01050826.1.p1  ORF type:complete len:186 (+),score=49.85 GHVS01050826.1:408-965(+)
MVYFPFAYSSDTPQTPYPCSRNNFVQSLSNPPLPLPLSPSPPPPPPPPPVRPPPPLSTPLHLLYRLRYLRLECSQLRRQVDYNQSLDDAMICAKCQVKPWEAVVEGCGCLLCASCSGDALLRKKRGVAVGTTREKEEEEVGGEATRHRRKGEKDSHAEKEEEETERKHCPNCHAVAKGIHAVYLS